MLKSGWTPTVLACAALVALTPHAHAQGVTTGAVAGTVTDQNGNPVAAAQVQAVNAGTGYASGVSTRSDGRYTVPGLEVGGYTLTVRRNGFQPQTRAVTVTLSQTARQDFVLSSQAAVLAGVVIQGAPSDLISPTRTGVATTISDSALRRLPTLNRNFTDFVALTPQVSTSGPGLSGGGTNNRFNNIQIDGATETDLFGLGRTGQPGGQADGKSIGIESVKEYQVLLSPYDVRQGNFSGVLINAVTKSGTNEFHGTAYGVTRNQSLTRTQPYITDYKQSQYGFSLGGPIVKDRAFFFINPEFQTRVSPAGGPYLGAPGVALQPAKVDSFTTLLGQYGIPAGSAGLVNNENPLANVFARLDFNLPGNSQLILRHNFGRAELDEFSRSTTSFRLNSNGYRFKSDKNATVAQLRTLFGNGSFNELFLNYTTIRDIRAPNVRAAQVTARAATNFNLVAGSERFSQGNALDQDIVELTDNFSVPVGSHRITVGTQNQFYKVRNLFTQASYGVWQFDSLDALRRGAATQYIVGVPLSGDGAVRFRAAQYAAYIEDEWAPTPRLNLTLGLRADIPTFGDRPPFNQSVLDSIGRNTSDIPTGNVQWSPRFGFNWDATGDQRNQVRGGLGLFTGRPAFVWLSNAFQNSGSVGVGVLTCNGAAAPAFTTAAAAQAPQQCANGLTAKAGGEIDLLDPNLKFPQNLRATLGYDRRFADTWIATVEGLYTKGVNGLFYQNIALKGPQGVDKFGRTIYGTAAFRPVTRTTDRNQVFDVTNQSNEYAWSLTGGLQHRFAGAFEGSVFYTYARANDVQSFTSSTAFSQYRFGRAWAGDQADNSATRSIFEQNHRIVAQGTYSFPTKTDVTFTFFGQSGTPYDYVVNGDPNGDGISLNDPIYVPRDARDPAEIVLDPTATAPVLAQQIALENFIQDTKCLRENRGRLLPRNACDNPWTNNLNVSVRQSLPTVQLQNVSLQIDVFNFLNLLNSSWGAQSTAGFGSQALLDYRRNIGPNLVTGTPVYSFNPNYQKFNSDFLASNYQVQVQLKYSF
ncbi:MAG: TonB-dependent receptor [Gemmatimonadaceae bacterium]